MSIEHASLTGNQLHEPKGASTASAGSVYVADGFGSGTWTGLNANNLFFNRVVLEGHFTDIGATDSIYFNVPVKSTLTKMNVILYGTLAGATDLDLTVYINGVLFADHLTVVNAGTAAGQKKTLLVTTPNTVASGNIITVTSNGGPTNSIRADVQLELTAIV